MDMISVIVASAHMVKKNPAARALGRFDSDNYWCGYRTTISRPEYCLRAVGVCQLANVLRTYSALI